MEQLFFRTETGHIARRLVPLAFFPGDAPAPRPAPRPYKQFFLSENGDNLTPLDIETLPLLVRATLEAIGNATPHPNVVIPRDMLVQLRDSIDGPHITHTVGRIRCPDWIMPRERVNWIEDGF